jgi:hypothetical protein
MFVFDNSEKTNSIFNTAFDYMRNNKVLNVPFFRAEMLPDEPFFAIALAIYNEKPFEDHERFSRALMNADDIHIDVIKGIAHFHSITHGNYVHPLVVHFCGRFGRFLFWREKIKLFFYFQIPHVKTTILQIMFKRKEDDTIYY